MTQPLPSNDQPTLPFTLDLGEHTLTIDSEGLTIADKVKSLATMQQVQLDDMETYRLHVTLQLLYAR